MGSAIKWHGGKHYLTPWLLAHAPPWESYTHYVEPYCGSCEMLLARPMGKSEVANDLNGDVVNFFLCLSDPLTRKDMLAALSVLPFHEALWTEATSSVPITPGIKVYDWRRACRFFVRNRLSYQGLGKSFAAISRSRTRGGRNEQVNALLGAIEGLPEIAMRLQDVLWLNRTAPEVLVSEDTPGTFFYLDPPYLHSTRTVKDAYEFEMTDEQHEEMLSIVVGLKGKVMLSGYDSELYQRKLAGWKRHEKEITNKAGGNARLMTEVIWCNYGQ